jgi:hypothetical protein
VIPESSVSRYSVIAAVVAALFAVEVSDRNVSRRPFAATDVASVSVR